METGCMSSLLPKLVFQCKRTMIRNIPREAVVEGTVIRRYYGMDLELGNSYNGESKEC